MHFNGAKFMYLMNEVERNEVDIFNRGNDIFYAEEALPISVIRYH